MKDPRDVIIAPVVSEKTYALIDQNVYTFKVHPDATKPEIAAVTSSPASPNRSARNRPASRKNSYMTAPSK